MKKLLLSLILISAGAATASAQCTITHAPSINTPLATNAVAGQSFTTTCAGDLNYVEVTCNTTGTIPAGTLTIYPGNSVTATPIHTQAFGPITIANVGDAARINIVGSVPVTNATQYTFTAFMNLDVLADLSYAGGHAWVGGVAQASIDVTFEVDIAIATGVNEEAISELTVSPNPAINVLKINTNEQVLNATVYSINGAIVKTTSDARTIDISELEAGMYILTVQTDKGTTQTRFVKQ
jgi:hypothetical protein